MRVVLLKDTVTTNEGGRWPYRYENVHYFGIDKSDNYIVVYSDDDGKVTTEAVPSEKILSFIDWWVDD